MRAFKVLSAAALTAAVVAHSGPALARGGGHSHSGPPSASHNTQPKPASSYRQPVVKSHDGRGHRVGQGIAASRVRKPLPPAKSTGDQGVAASSKRQPLPPANTKNSGPPQAVQVEAGGGTPGSQAGFVWVPNNGALPGHWERASNVGKANPVTEVRDHAPGDGNKLFVDGQGKNRAGDPVIVDRNGNKVTIVHEGDKTYLVDSNGKPISFKPREGVEPDIGMSLLLPLAVPGALIVGGAVGEPIGALNSVLAPPPGEASTRATVDHRGEKAAK
jgi:hypothetical protein